MSTSAPLNVADLFDRLEESVTIYDREARLLYMNAAAVRPFGRPVAELLGKRPWELVPAPRDGKKTPFREALEAVLADGTRRTATTFVEGIGRWYEVEVYPHPQGAFATARNVTEARRAHDELQRSEARFRAMVEFAPEAIVILDNSTGLFCDANPEAERLFGKTREQLMKIGPADLMLRASAETAAERQRARETLMRGEISHSEWQAIGARGEVLTIEVTGRRLPGTDPVLIRASVVDVTARRRAQEQLADVQRLEAIARLAGGVAHDFNNMLSIILGCTQLALSALPPDHPVTMDLESVMSAAERSALITRQLLAFGRKQVASPRVLDLTAYIEQVQSVLRRLVGEDVELALDLARPLGGALVDPAHVEQILINLVANARDAMPKGGRITLHTANVFLDGEYERLHNGVPPGKYVLLSVADTGEGIPEAVKPHIFEPFFTTKALDRGTGLGLATVHGIVKHNGGHIWVYSEPGLGSTFKVYLPLVEGDASVATPPAEDVTKRAGGTETILIVEDEDGVRALLRRALRRAGYTLLEASNAGEALLLCEQHVGRIHLMLSDVVMPRMTGPQLVARLRPLRTDMRIIFISGYSEERLDGPEHAATHDGFLAKPVAVEALLRCVREVLDR